MGKSRAGMQIAAGMVGGIIGIVLIYLSQYAQTSCVQYIFQVCVQQTTTRPYYIFEPIGWISVFISIVIAVVGAIRIAIQNPRS